jgi:SAM-dependent methyltransferase
MNLKPYYEESYLAENSRSISSLKEEVEESSKGLFHLVKESKDRFLSSKDWNGLRVLELGAGRGGLSLHLARLGAEVTLLDFSHSALAQAEKIFSTEGLSLQTIEADATLPTPAMGGKFDLIVDSHLLHCLTEDPQRASYYALVKESLASGGIFVCESMVHRKKLHIPDGFMFDQKNVLWQMFGKWTPVRRILDSLDLEKELGDAGLSIKSFFYYGQYSFVPHQSFMEIPAEVLPASVRFVASN